MSKKLTGNLYLDEIIAESPFLSTHVPPEKLVTPAEMIPGTVFDLHRMRQPNKFVFPDVVDVPASTYPNPCFDILRRTAHIMGIFKKHTGKSTLEVEEVIKFAESATGNEVNQRLHPACPELVTFAEGINRLIQQLDKQILPRLGLYKIPF